MCTTCPWSFVRSFSSGAKDINVCLRTVHMCLAMEHKTHIIEANVPKYEGAVLYCTHGYLFCPPHFNSGTGFSACHTHHGINHMKARTLIFIKRNMSIRYRIFLYIICFFFFFLRFKDNKIFTPFLSFFHL